jgi:hypothetical protein
MSDNMNMIWAALAVALLGIAPAHAQSSTTNCYRSGNGTVYETRDYYGHTVQRTECWPAGRGNVTCKARDNPNGYDLTPTPRGFRLDDKGKLPGFPL